MSQGCTSHPKTFLCAHGHIDKASSSSVTLVFAQGRVARTDDKCSDDAASAVNAAATTCQASTLGRTTFSLVIVLGLSSGFRSATVQYVPFISIVLQVTSHIMNGLRHLFLESKSPSSG